MKLVLLIPTVLTSSVLQSITKRPPVVGNAQCAEFGQETVNILKSGPPNVEEVVYWEGDGYKWTDESFSHQESLFNSQFQTDQQDYSTSISNRSLQFQRWTETFGFENAVIFKDETIELIEYHQNQETMENCYFLTSVQLAYEKSPSIIVDMVKSRWYDYKLVTMRHNHNKMYLVQFYVRGKAWIVGIDDIMPFKQKFVQQLGPSGEILSQQEELYLYYGQPDREMFSGVMWGPIIEKAFAKIMGSYTNLQKGYIQNSMRAFLNCPMMTYYTANIPHNEIVTEAGQQTQIEIAYQTIEASYYLNYPIVFGTPQSETDDLNGCGLRPSHSYHLQGAFRMTSENFQKILIIVLQDQYFSKSDYNGTWNENYYEWTDFMKLQIPNQFLISDEQSNLGYIYIEMAEIANTNKDCISHFVVAHYRKDEGFQDSYYDAENMDETLQRYMIVDTGQATDELVGDVYITVETYYPGIIPTSCTSGTYSTYSLTSPVIDFSLYSNTEVMLDYKLYSDQFSIPIIRSLQTVTVFPAYYLDVHYRWFESPSRDYTVKVYSKRKVSILDSNKFSSFIEYDGQEPSGFSESTFRGMGWLPEVNTFIDAWIVAQKSEYPEIMFVWQVLIHPGVLLPWKYPDELNYVWDLFLSIIGVQQSSEENEKIEEFFNEYLQ